MSNHAVINLSVKADPEYVTVQRSPDGEPEGVRLSLDLATAAVWVNQGRTAFHLTQEAIDAIGDRWGTSPEKSSILRWLELRQAKEDEGVIYFVAANVIAEWLSIPARTVSEHRKLYAEIAETSRNLASLLESTKTNYYRGGGHGLRSINVYDLRGPGEFPGVNDDVSVTSSFPRMEDLLGRVASAADRLREAGPIHSQPKKRGARNGYFIRRMHELLISRYGDCPAEVLASIASVALDTIIDADLVKKTVGVTERSTKKKSKNVLG